MKMFLDDIIQVVIVILLVVLIYNIGYEASERKQCITNGGKYSLDYGRCENEKK